MQDFGLLLCCERKRPISYSWLWNLNPLGHATSQKLYDQNCWKRLSEFKTDLWNMMSLLWKLSGDSGAIFACVGSMQAIAGFFNPVYNKIYNTVKRRKNLNRMLLIIFHVLFQTLGWNPGAVYLVPCGFYFVILIILVYCLVFLR